MIQSEIIKGCSKCKCTNSIRFYCQDCIDEIKKNLAIQIFDELYFGDSNIIVIGERPCLQTLNFGGTKLLKHKYLVEFCNNYLDYFLKLSSKYTDGERGRVTNESKDK
jgi:hypothetical protein